MQIPTFYFPVPVEIDEYDLVDPVDILTPLEKSGFWDGVVRYLSGILTYCWSNCHMEK